MFDDVRQNRVNKNMFPPHSFSPIAPTHTHTYTLRSTVVATVLNGSLIAAEYRTWLRPVNNTQLVCCIIDCQYLRQCHQNNQWCVLYSEQYSNNPLPYMALCMVSKVNGTMFYCVNWKSVSAFPVLLPVKTEDMQEGRKILHHQQNSQNWKGKYMKHHYNASSLQEEKVTHGSVISSWHNFNYAHIVWGEE